MVVRTKGSREEIWSEECGLAEKCQGGDAHLGKTACPSTEGTPLPSTLNSTLGHKWGEIKKASTQW